jgi:hypothetical protein
MRYYSSQPEKYQESEFPPIWPCDFIDATGTVIPEKWVVAANLDTGIVTVFAVDKDERFKVDDSGNIITLDVCYPPPLQIIPMVKNEEVKPDAIVGGSE